MSLILGSLLSLALVPAAHAAEPSAGCPSVGKNWAAPGPFAVTAEAGGTEHTIYRPSELGGCGRHPVLVWGNGTGASVSVYEPMLRHFASHGFIVAAANTAWSGSGTEMRAGIDYLTQQNGSAGSVFHDKVDLEHVGATGHSQGGGGAVASGADPRVDTVVPIEPGPQGSVEALHGPVFWLAGQLDLVVLPNLLVYPRYQQSTQVPAVFGELAGASHFTPVGDGGGFRGPITAWFRFHLMGDELARGEFFGDGCGNCDSPAWSRFERNAKATEPPRA
ncbi:chlorophyllase/cutinase-like alpha/beta fold protein [Amycolatopsis nigrescens]|uniref:poly(ethylene terephthalate) hydrolase family protein n=1 Tax=Amycolatopsis nigrescens TaxID=381445 RepID=UPI001FDECC30|nr:acetylxylan esterase [Amycolatopsis nigrescens]